MINNIGGAIMKNNNIKKCWFCRWLGKCKDCEKHNNDGCIKIEIELNNEEIATLLNISVRTFYKRMQSPVKRRMTANTLRAKGFEVFEEESEEGKPTLVVYDTL